MQFLSVGIHHCKVAAQQWPLNIPRVESAQGRALMRLPGIRNVIRWRRPARGLALTNPTGLLRPLAGLLAQGCHRRPRHRPDIGSVWLAQDRSDFDGHHQAP